VSLDTTKPPQVSDLDWTTIDPLRAMTLGKALATKGYVYWRPQRVEWIVLSPTQNGRYETVCKEYPMDQVVAWWILLKCTCPNGSNPDGPCVHKCAVHKHATNPSEFSYYAEG